MESQPASKKDNRKTSPVRPKRKAYEEITVEELQDNEDAGYDGDVEVRRPDEYEELETDCDSIYGSNDDDDTTNETKIVERLRRLNCDPDETHEAGRFTETFRKSRNWRRGHNRLKRSFSQSQGNASDVDVISEFEIDDAMHDSPVVRQRVELRGEETVNGERSVDEPTSPAVKRICPLRSRSSSRTFRRAYDTAEEDAMDVDSQVSNDGMPSR